MYLQTLRAVVVESLRQTQPHQVSSNLQGFYRVNNLVQPLHRLYLKWLNFPVTAIREHPRFTKILQATQPSYK